ncbi:hypothetical protein AV530_007302 [Patagioenas fasciata monilis]|uniref:Uncharacterized protein n=1 Tax=Patagioenas fasciata monilis TaxID=372326 RepID=A0A1V4JX96_PATFA|nr:hypothetical protein AV530_007302 [Patagioenas fasciata monilis]
MEIWGINSTGESGAEPRGPLRALSWGQFRVRPNEGDTGWFFASRGQILAALCMAVTLQPAPLLSVLIFFRIKCCKGLGDKGEDVGKGRQMHEVQVTD